MRYGGRGTVRNCYVTNPTTAAAATGLPLNCHRKLPHKTETTASPGTCRGTPCHCPQGDDHITRSQWATVPPHKNGDDHITVYLSRDTTSLPSGRRPHHQVPVGHRTATQNGDDHISGDLSRDTTSLPSGRRPHLQVPMGHRTATQQRRRPHLRGPVT